MVRRYGRFNPMGKSSRLDFLTFWLVVLQMIPLAGLPSVAAGQNRALQLNGDGGYVELPSEIFNDLQTATIEGWVKWTELGSFSRFFDFGEEWRSINLTHTGTSPEISFSIINGPASRERVECAGMLQVNQWCHIAAVCGAPGMKLYFNGELIGTNATTTSFATLKNGQHNYLGKSNWGQQFGDTPFHGQMDEVRVWRLERTPEQIRENMFKVLTGNEPGLMGLWNFDDGAAKDATPNGHDGKLLEGATVVVVELPSPAQLIRPMLISGTVTDPTHKAVANVEVNISQDGNP